jgi:hypothetical protein
VKSDIWCALHRNPKGQNTSRSSIVSVTRNPAEPFLVKVFDLEMPFLALWLLGFEKLLAYLRGTGRTCLIPFNFLQAIVKRNVFMKAAQLGSQRESVVAKRY